MNKLTHQDKKLKLPLSFGNSKIDGGNVMIFNITSATDCETDRLGMCPFGPKNGDKSCYAFKAERIYKQVIPYRRRQTEYWDHHFDPRDFVNAMKKKTKVFRFNESGDFRNQEDVDKMYDVCYHLRNVGCVSYGYTRRPDLDLSELANISTLLVSGSTVHNCSETCVIGRHDEPPEGWFLCPGKHCMNGCSACLKRGNKIAFRRH